MREKELLLLRHSKLKNQKISPQRTRYPFPPQAPPLMTPPTPKFVSKNRSTIELANKIATPHSTVPRHKSVRAPTRNPS